MVAATGATPRGMFFRAPPKQLPQTGYAPPAQVGYAQPQSRFQQRFMQRYQQPIQPVPGMATGGMSNGRQAVMNAMSRMPIR